MEDGTAPTLAPESEATALRPLSSVYQFDKVAESPGDSKDSKEDDIERGDEGENKELSDQGSCDEMYNKLSRTSTSIRAAKGQPVGYLFMLFESERTWVYYASMVLLVVLFYVICIAFYTQDEGWNIIESAYFVTVAISTVGYGDYHPTTDESFCFTFFVIVLGVVLIYAILVNVADNIIEYLEVKGRQDRAERQPSASFEVDITKNCLKIALSATIIVAVLLLGGTFFMHYDGMTFLQATYFAVETATSIGFGDYAPKNDPSRLFDILYIIISNTTFVVCASRITTAIQEIRADRKKIQALSRRLDIDMIRELDVDGDGVDKFEFVFGLLVLLMVVEPKDFEPWVEKFEHLDADGSGVLDEKDIFLLRQDMENSVNLAAMIRNIDTKGQQRNTVASEQNAEDQRESHASSFLSTSSASQSVYSENSAKSTSPKQRTLSVQQSMMRYRDAHIRRQASTARKEAKGCNLWSYHVQLRYCIVIALYYIIGVSFYTQQEGWTIGESAYMLTQIVTTVGYGDYVPLTEAGMIFTIFWMLIGVGVVTYHLILFIEDCVTVVEGFMVNHVCTLAYGEGYEALQRVLASAVMLCVWILVGSLFAVEYEGFSFFHSTYFNTVTTFSVGFGDFKPLSWEAQLFTIFYMLFTVLLLFDSLGNLGLLHLKIRIEQRKRAYYLGTLDFDMLAELDHDGKGVDKFAFVSGVCLQLGILRKSDIDSFVQKFEELDADHSGKLDQEDIDLLEGCIDDLHPGATNSGKRSDIDSRAAARAATDSLDIEGAHKQSQTTHSRSSDALTPARESCEPSGSRDSYSLIYPLISRSEDSVAGGRLDDVVEAKKDADDSMPR